VFSVFFLLFFTNILNNVDHGSLPGCFNAIKDKLQVENFGFGILGSIVFVGLIFGSIVASGLFSRGEWIKLTLLVALSLNAVSLYAFTQSSSFYFMVIVRGAIGFFQVFVCIFMPVWVDTYGSESQKSIWLTVNMLASPLGVVLGYTLTYYMNLYHSWEWSFKI
jgi:predicted MFS family arabinose efflux permease